MAVEEDYDCDKTGPETQLCSITGPSQCSHKFCRSSSLNSPSIEVPTQKAFGASLEGSSEADHAQRSPAMGETIHSGSKTTHSVVLRLAVSLMLWWMVTAE